MKHSKNLIALLIGAITVLSPVAEACSKITYVGANGNVLTGNNMDWDRGFDTNLWVLPAGLNRTGEAGRSAENPFHGPNDLHWKSKYGSLIITSSVFTHDGLNEKSLSVTVHNDAFADYGKPQPNRKDVSIGFINQYLLDNFATVDEAVKGMQKINAVSIPAKMGNGLGYSIMFGITDASGDNAVFQWRDGKMLVFHGKQYNVLANEGMSPTTTYGDEFKVLDYYRGINAARKTAPVSLPGSYGSEDRIARFGYYLDIAPKESDIDSARMWTFNMIRALRPPVPLEEPNLPGLVDINGWTSVADLKYQRFYIDIPKLLAPYYVDFSELDFKPGAPIRKLPVLINHGQQQPAQVIPYSGDISAKLVATKPDSAWDIK